MKLRASKLLLLAPVLFIVTQCGAQNVFTYGNHTVSKEEFLKAYNKNNQHGKATEKSYSDYLELYERYKLKVQAALDAKMDTLPSQKGELLNFRNQVVENYMKDDESLAKMAHEVFINSQKDVRLAHIFVALPANPTPADTMAAWQRISTAWADLKSGKKFGEAALQYSDDPSAKTNLGEIGFISTFVLPYDLEQLAYKTPAGQFSKPYRDKNGYHIFKNIEERKAWGKIKVAQILLGFPPAPTDDIKSAAKQRADSLYEALMKGASFADMARAFSTDNLSFQTGGELPVFGVGKYDASFETAAFSLAKNGDISKPVLTSFGYHIIRRLARFPAPTEENAETISQIKQEISNSPRVEISRSLLLQRILKVTKFSRKPFSENDLWSFTDSTIKNRPLPKNALFEKNAVLFSFPKKNITIKDWLEYITPIENTPALFSGKTHTEITNQYIQAICYDYYREHLEEYNSNFLAQLNEFRDGNLLFEIMQRNVWDKAANDSTGIKKYYDEHKNNYWWQPSADAVLFTCSNEHTAEELKKNLQKNPSLWKTFADSSNGMVQADSARFELTALPMAEGNRFNDGSYSSFVTNQTDNTVTFAYILKLHEQKVPRDFKDARGFVINDYQNSLEDKWVAQLRKKYPVQVNEAVFRALPK